VLVELSVMEQRYQAVLAVIQDGWKPRRTQCELHAETGRAMLRLALKIVDKDGYWWVQWFNVRHGLAGSVLRRKRRVMTTASVISRCRIS
jgi:hypothetical protein